MLVFSSCWRYSSWTRDIIKVAAESCETEEVIGPLLPVQETSEVDETINVPTARTISIPRTPGDARP